MKDKCKSFVWVVVVFNLILCICGNIVVITSNNNRKFLSSSTTTTATTPVTTTTTAATTTVESATTLGNKTNDLPETNNAIDGKGAPGATTPKIDLTSSPPPPPLPRKRNLNVTKDVTATAAAPTTSTNNNVKINPTTYRPSRQTSLNSTDRDSQLMNLLAARRNALQRDRTYRPHRRTPTTGRTSEELVADISTSSTSVTNIESTSKAPNDSRSVCVRNCTKNFTKRTTASCMRQCAGIKRANASQPSVRTKVDEKDNNEILLTDESSHGFFVVTKELNDTANHIAPSTEKTRKLRNKSRQPVAAVVDDGPYGYYGQKLQTNKPTVLRISQVSDDHPKILEVSAVPRPQTPVERSRSRSRYNPRDRVSAFARRQGVVNATRGPTSTTLRTTSTLPSTPQTLPTLSTPTTSHTIILLKDEVIPPKYKDIQVGFKPKHREDSFKPIKSEISLNLFERSTVLDQVQERQPIVEVLPPTTKTTTTTTTTSTTTTAKPTTRTTITTTTTTTTRAPTTTRPTHPSTPLLISVPELEIPRETTRYFVITSTRPSTTTTTEIPVKEIIEEEEHRQVNTGDQPNLIVFLNRTEEDIRTVTTTLSPVTIPTTSTTVDGLNKISISENSSSFFEIFGNSIPISSDSKVTEFVNSSKEESEVKIETHSMNVAAYVLSGIGMLPLIVIAVYLVKTFVAKKWTKHHNDLDICVTDQQPISPVRKMCKHEDDDDDDSRDDGYSITSDQEIDRKNLHFKCLLGEGNFGQVWKAEADDLTGHYGTTRIVAVKTVRSGSTQDGLKDEAAIMKKLGSHTNVVTILGACLEAEPHLLIMEYAMRGRLLSLLRAARSANNILPASVPGGRSLAPLSPRTLGGFALDIARGMEYISDRKIVHRDLAARNVLLDHNGVCKICDFGMSIDLDSAQKSRSKQLDLMTRPKSSHGLDHRFKFDFGNRLITQWSHSFSNNSDEKKQHHHDEVGKRPALPIRWMAPEALQYHMFSTETDVWAFGIVLWEIATLGCTPYPNLSGREVVRMIPAGTRPDFPSEGRTEFYDLMSACWHKDPRQRPTFRESRYEISKTLGKWVDDDATSDYMDVSGFSEDLEHGMVYFNRRISEFECDI